MPQRRVFREEGGAGSPGKPNVGTSDGSAQSFPQNLRDAGSLPWLLTCVQTWGGRGRCGGSQRQQHLRVEGPRQPSGSGDGTVRAKAGRGGLGGLEPTRGPCCAWESSGVCVGSPYGHPQVLGWREQDLGTEVPLGEVRVAAPCSLHPHLPHPEKTCILELVTSWSWHCGWADPHCGPEFPPVPPLQRPVPRAGCPGLALASGALTDDGVGAPSRVWGRAGPGGSSSDWVDVSRAAGLESGRAPGPVPLLLPEPREAPVQARGKPRHAPGSRPVHGPLFGG